MSLFDTKTACVSCGSSLHNRCFGSNLPVFTRTRNCLTHFRHLRALNLLVFSFSPSLSLSLSSTSLSHLSEIYLYLHVGLQQLIKVRSDNWGSACHQYSTIYVFTCNNLIVLTLIMRINPLKVPQYENLTFSELVHIQYIWVPMVPTNCEII